MGIARGTNIIRDGLVFGYDTGYGIADNTTATRFYPGEATTNYVTDSSLLQSGWTGSYSLIDSATKSFQFNVSNFNGAAGSGQGWRSFMWDMRAHAGSAVTISATIEVPDDSPGDFAWVMMGQANSRSSGTTTATYLGYSSSSERYQKTTSTTERISWSGTIGNTGTANQPNGIIGFTVWYNGGTSGTNSFIKVSNVQIEKISHATPFVNGTRSSTQSLIDLKRTTDIDVSNVSFDSTGQPDFDGSNDNINFGNIAALQNLATGAIEIVYHRDASTGTYQMIFTDAGSDLEITYSGNTLQFYIGNSGLSYTHAVTGQYFHVVGIWGTGYKKLYLNGSLVASGTNTGVDTGSRTRYVGGRGTSFPFNGKIPVTKVYSKALTTEEISNNFKAYKNRFNI